MAKHNRAAFSPADVADSKRGHPDFDLRDYAAQRELEFIDHGTPMGLRPALPCEEELQSNVMRGVLPGGEYGVLANEGLEIGWTNDSPDWGGSFYSTRVTAKGDLKGAALSAIPLVGLLAGSAPTAVVRLPCTVAGVRVPEAPGVQTCIRIDRRRSTPPFSFGNRVKLDELVGDGGWSLWGEPKPDPELVAGLVAEPVAGLLRAHSEDGLFQLIGWSGMLMVRRNGFLRSPEHLDELARAASLVAARLREVCRPLAQPRPFDASLPPPTWQGGDEAPPGFEPTNRWRTWAIDPTDAWRKWALETAGRYGLTLEDSIAYHRAFPSVPVPGQAYVVLRGTIPHLGESGRLVVHRERDAARAAVLIAAPRAEPTPPGGRLVPDHGVRLEVADGLLAVWDGTSYWGSAMAGDLDEFCARAAGVIGEAAR